MLRVVRFPFGDLGVRVGLSLLATAIAVLLFMNPWRGNGSESTDGWQTVALVRKDASFHALAADAHDPRGSVRYLAKAPHFRMQLRVGGLDPAKHVILEMDVDGTVYDVGSYRPRPNGALVLDTALTQFAEGTCVGRNFDPARPLQGDHRIKIWLKRDGNIATGGERAPNGQWLTCSGNGDGNFAYVLLEGASAHYTYDATAPSGP